MRASKMNQADQKKVSVYAAIWTPVELVGEEHLLRTNIVPNNVFLLLGPQQ